MSRTMDDPERGMENARELRDAKLQHAIRSAVADTLSRNLEILAANIAPRSMFDGIEDPPVFRKSDVQKMLHASAPNLAMVIAELVRQ